MQKRTKILLAVSVLLAVLLLAAIGFLYYRTTPHYSLRHEHYADVTLDDGTVIRVVRRPNMEEKSFYNELVIKEIQYLGSDTLVLPSSVGGYPVTEIGYFAAPFFLDGVDFRNGIKSLTLPDGLISFDYVGQLFGLETLHVGKATAYLAHLDPQKLQTITVHPDNTRYRMEGNCLIDKQTNSVALGTVNSVIPEGITAIDVCAFYWRHIAELSLPNSLQSIGNSALAFTDITALTLPEGLTALGSGSFAGIKIKELVLPAGISAIPEDLLFACSELESLTIGKNVTAIDSSAFWYCKGLREIVIDLENPNYYVDGTSLVEKDSDRLVLYFGNEPLSKKVRVIGTSSITDLKAPIRKIALPSGVEEIEELSICGNGDLIAAFIPSSVTKIEKSGIILPGGTIYCEAAEKPSGWDEKWTSGSATVHFGCNLEEFSALENQP